VDRESPEKLILRADLGAVLGVVLRGTETIPKRPRCAKHSPRDASRTGKVAAEACEVQGEFDKVGAMSSSRARAPRSQVIRKATRNLGALGLIAFVAFVATMFGLGPSACNVHKASVNSEGGPAINCWQVMDCPASNDPCVVSTCYEQRCLMVPAAGNTVVKKQDPGDCRMRVCDGNGGVTEIPDEIDVPGDDGNPCTAALCKDGEGAHEPVALGEACGESGVCNGKGVCGVCLPGASRCDGNATSTCGDEGQWSKVPCPAGRPICKSASCIGLRAVAAGGANTCAMFEDGSVRCYGASGSRRGGGPVEQVGSVLGAVELALGAAFSCARLGDGTVTCWGDNSFGQIGDGTTLGPRPPTPVLGLSGATAIAAGDEHVCALVAGGKIDCWGRGDHNRLGAVPKPAPPLKKPAGDEEGLPEDQASPGGPPTLAPGLFGVGKLFLGRHHGCGLWPGGRVGCFGDEIRGELGGAPAPGGKPKIGPKPSSKLVVVAGLEHAVALSLGARHGCALLEGGVVSCFGDNAAGQLGDGTTEARATATIVKELSGVTALSLGRTHGCALVAGGAVKCFGDNSRGQLGDGTTTPKTSPVTVNGLTGVRALSAGGDHTCVMLADGAIRCWGGNDAGEVGDGTTDDRPSPSPVAW